MWAPLRDPTSSRPQAADKDRVATAPVEDDPLAGEELSMISITAAAPDRTALRPSPDDIEPIISLVLFLLGQLLFEEVAYRIKPTDFEGHFQRRFLAW